MPFDRSIAMESLTSVVQDLSRARTIEAVQDIVRHAARALTGADGATFVLRDGDRCYYADEDAIAPLWKGQRFPLGACISGWAMLNARSVVIEDIYKDPRIPADAYRPTFVKSLVMVPIRRAAPIGAIGNYWARQREPSDAEVQVLQALADSTSVAMENVELYRELQQKIETLSIREARIREQRDTLDVFARSLAHDLKQPAHTVHQFAELLVNNNFPEEMRRDYTRFVHEAGTRMAMLIDAVFNYTQLDPDTMSKERFLLGDAYSAATAELSDLIAERGATIVRSALPEVYANYAQTVLVLQHLIRNAIMHNPKPTVIQLSAIVVDDVTRICVRDNGPGIAEEDRARIFDPFRRLAIGHEHAGLGLAMCRKIVEFHGGEITCASEPGDGAAFFFTLPNDPERAIPLARSA
jgi:signal transduction histidine kinase